LLARALRSLRQQTHPRWKAIVLDDSPDREALAVVAAAGDTRIAYHSNPSNLGAAANLDQAFSPQPLLGGDQAFVLEDDNALDSGFIARGVQLLAGTDNAILSFNQRRIDFAADGTETPAGLLRENPQEEIWDHERLLLNAFIGVSLPNGGYFWKLGENVNLTVGPEITEPQFQECVRQIKITQPVRLCPQPLSLWSMLPQDQLRRRPVSHRRLAANLNQLSRGIAVALGPHRLSRLARLHLSAESAARVSVILTDLSLLCPSCLPWLHRHPWQAMRSMLRFYLYRDSMPAALEAVLSLHAQKITQEPS
jgi:hypothetical protein